MVSSGCPSHTSGGGNRLKQLVAAETATACRRELPPVTAALTPSPSNSLKKTCTSATPAAAAASLRGRRAPRPPRAGDPLPPRRCWPTRRLRRPASPRAAAAAAAAKAKGAEPAEPVEPLPSPPGERRSPLSSPPRRLRRQALRSSRRSSSAASPSHLAPRQSVAALSVRTPWHTAHRLALPQVAALRR